ncbi:DUF1810 domain-containing protein [Pseudomonas sp. v388]|uniref:DUF1810 domain-containing protein n=1 Tax=Pseudomonas sp. v388 TaxID=2479849 RepID=UPI000F780EDA|nr:DUF1810 domain-containing protein [Pseudomonas sp. v388]RRV10819.1 DUF1810 domain-containing protein [Pseudomonas sp. v388]
MHEDFDLDRFVHAQRAVYGRAMDELPAGLKTSHWMWFIFPQLQGLGRSDMAQRFGISCPAEAHAYLQHPLLGPRLQCCARTLLDHHNKTAHQIFGSHDDLKLRSSLTLFAAMNSDSSVYQKGLDQFFDCKPDEKTLQMLQPAPRHLQVEVGRGSA